MNAKEAKKVLQALLAAYPHQPELEPSAVAMYASALARFDFGLGMAAAAEIVRTESRFPSVHRLIAACQSEERRLVSYRNDPRELEVGTDTWRRRGLTGVAQARSALESRPKHWPDLDEPEPESQPVAG
jgi:hypothetical protein